MIKEADENYASDQPFFNFIMTTSNHRPYTYPENKIDIPSDSGRDGAVKYTNYAIGQFLKKAKSKDQLTLLMQNRYGTGVQLLYKF